MHITLPYGTEQVNADVPDNWINGRCYRPHRPKACVDVRAELLAALNALPAEMTLSRLSQGKGTCAIAVDGAQAALFPDLLPSLVEVIEDETPIRAASITIVVANRAENPMTPARLGRLVQSARLPGCQVVLHDYWDSASLVSLGVTSRGVPVTVNRHFATADLKVVLGGVRPDPILGFTGGRAVILPGLCGADTLLGLYRPEFVLDRNSRYGNFRDNPFHMAGVEAMGLVGCHLSVNAVMSPAGDITSVIVGHFGASHLQAMNALRQSLITTVKEPMDIVVTSGGGHPFDSSLLEVVRALSATTQVLKPGGTVVMAAALRDGFAPAPLLELLAAYRSPRDAAAGLLREGPFVPGKWLLLRLTTTLRNHELILFNRDIDEEALWTVGVTPSRDMNEAVHGAMEGHGQRCKIVALPEGPMGIGEVAAAG
jgi:nickel-dependent lactate racemase